ncbi:general secretion pathway protein [Synechococcus sp. Nb3U1]|uniref:ATPase, T2SS/T4P/T4SS family n=1 Tax=Synechococcus sp. Nb3U1 TaxID=1914529 RepID=UPI001F2B61E2|nr:general secretion pathway protein [Synechococcus sp. Nb3U1]MCF2969866.1 general secretion pathway protein [Synechococcus sp. Nb3U1]
MTDPDASLAVGRHTKIDRTRIPALIAQYLPVEICIYYQVVPVALDTDSLILGMVDPQDLAALDYVGKMLAYSQISVEPIPLTFEQQQDLIAYYFSHPPDPAEVAQLRLQAQANRVTREVPTPKGGPETQMAPAVPSPASQTSPPAPPSESEETVQQLLNSMLRRALDEKADQIFVEPQEGVLCRVRYRQQGILRDLFRELSESVRSKLLASMKRMMALDPDLIGEPQQAEVERMYKGEPLVLQLRVILQRSKEGAILNILRGEALQKYQQNQNNGRVTETLALAQQAHQMLQQLQMTLSSTVDKLKQYPSPPNTDWPLMTETLTAIQVQAQMIAAYQQDWEKLNSSK